MAKLKTETRNKLPADKFAEPEKRAYPIEDKAHARNAKARASQAVDAGHSIRVETEDLAEPSPRAEADTDPERPPAGPCAGVVGAIPDEFLRQPGLQGRRRRRLRADDPCGQMPDDLPVSPQHRDLDIRHGRDAEGPSRG